MVILQLERAIAIALKTLQPVVPVLLPPALGLLLLQYLIKLLILKTDVDNSASQSVSQSQHDDTDTRGSNHQHATDSFLISDSRQSAET